MSIIEAINRVLPKNAFVRNVLVLGGGAAGSQVISILSAPLLTRLYSTEDFGVFAVFIALLSIISVISSLRYEQAIPIAKDEEEAIHVAVLAFMIAMLISFLTALVIAFFRQKIAVLVGSSALSNYLWLLPLSLLLLSTYQILHYWAIRVKAFPEIARTKLTLSISSVVFKLSGTALGALALIFGHAISQVAGMFSLILIDTSQIHLIRTVRISKLFRVARQYQKFPLYASWGSIVNALGAQAPSVLLASSFSLPAAGLYSLANKLLSLPMLLVGQAIGNVFFSKGVDAQREGSLSQLVAQVNQKLIQIAMPPALLLIVVGPNLFAWIFGPEWREAGVFARLMVPMLYLQFVFSPISPVYIIRDKQEQAVALQVILLVIRCTALLVGAWQNDLRLSVMLFALGSAICYLIFLLWAVQISGNHWSTVLKNICQELFLGVMLISPLIIAILYTSNQFILSGVMVISILMICYRYSALLRTAW